MNQWIKKWLLLGWVGSFLFLTACGSKGDIQFNQIQSLNKIAVVSVSYDRRMSAGGKGPLGGTAVGQLIGTSFKSADPEEAKFYDSITEQLIEILEDDAAIKLLPSKQFQSNPAFVKATTNPEKKSLYIPSGYRFLKLHKVKDVSSLCENLGVDAVASVRFHYRQQKSTTMGVLTKYHYSFVGRVLVIDKNNQELANFKVVSDTFEGRSGMVFSGINLSSKSESLYTDLTDSFLENLANFVAEKSAEQ